MNTILRYYLPLSLFVASMLHQILGMFSHDMTWQKPMIAPFWMVVNRVYINPAMSSLKIAVAAWNPFCRTSANPSPFFARTGWIAHRAVIAMSSAVRAWNTRGGVFLASMVPGICQAFDPAVLPSCSAGLTTPS